MVDLKQQHTHSSYFLNCRKMPQYILKAGRRENASTWLVFHVQKWCVLCWKCWILRVSSSKQNWRRCRSSEGTCLWKQKNKYLWFDNVLEMSFGSLGSTLKDYLNMHLISPYLCPAIGWGAEENWVSVYQDPQERMETTFWLIFPNFSIMLKGWRFSDIAVIKAESHDALANLKNSVLCTLC